jgi:hypothetical protein
MIELIRDLDAPQQKRLIRVLDPRAETDELSEAEVFPALLEVLRRALEVPPKDDLPEYLRRRLVDVVRRQFDLVEREETDALTDFELAQTLVDFILESAEKLAGDKEWRVPFETFLRTKDRVERVRWLVDSEQFGALMTSQAFDRAGAKRRAEELQREKKAHEGTAKAMLSEIAAATGPGEGGTKPHPSAQSGRLAGLAGGAAVGPLGALAGGLFMAGLGKRELEKRELLRVAEKEAKATRAQRARRSKQVQAIVSLSAFLVANRVAPEARGHG